MMASMDYMKLFFVYAMDIENLLNYHCENVAMMKSSTDEKIIQEVMGTSVDNDHDPNASYSYQMFP